MLLANASVPAYSPLAEYGKQKKEWQSMMNWENRTPCPNGAGIPARKSNSTCTDHDCRDFQP